MTTLYRLPGVIADTYGSGGYGNNLYSASGTQSSGGTSGTSGTSGSGNSLVDTGSAAILITVVAAVILVTTLIVSLRHKKKPTATSGTE